MKHSFNTIQELLNSEISNLNRVEIITVIVRILIVVIVGILSGYLVDYFSTPPFGFPKEGFIFGIISAPFFWYYLRSKWKPFVWIIISGISYLLAFQSEESIREIFSIDLLGDGYKTTTIEDFYLLFGFAGLIGSIILLIGFRFLVSIIPSLWIFFILFFGTMIPTITLDFFGLRIDSSSWGLRIFPNAPYMLVMMTIWQTVMLFIFVHLLQRESKKIFL